MFRFRPLLLLFIMVLPLMAAAQESEKRPNIILQLQQAKPDEGVVVISQDLGIAEMLSDYRDINSKIGFIEGYRIQLYSGSGVNSKKEAMAIRVKFLSLFPSEMADLYYNAPFWRVRVGNYRYKNEALPLLNKVKKQFPSSYMVKDNNIKKSDVK